MLTSVSILLLVGSAVDTSVSVVAPAPDVAVRRLAQLEARSRGEPILPATAFAGLPRPGPSVEFRATAAGSMRSDRLTVIVEAVSEGRVVARRRYAFAWRSKVAVVVPAADIGPGQVLTSADLTRSEVELTGDTSRYALAPEQLVGRITRLHLTKNRPVMLTDVVLPTVVERGDVIRVRATFGSLVVSMKAEALEDGAVGDVIRVRNAASNKNLEAEILDHGLAEVKR